MPALGLGPPLIAVAFVLILTPHAEITRCV